MNREHLLPQILLRSWPFPRGAGRIIDRYFGQLRFSSNEATVRTKDGFLLTIPPNDLIGRHIYLSGEFDRTTAEILINFAEPEDTLLDVGANIGYMSACFLQNVPRSTVVAVEPQPIVSDLCQRNLAQFGARASVVPIALSDVSGTLPFVIERGNYGGSHLADCPSESAVNVPVQSAAEFFERQNFNKLDLMKIDVEGHEENVIRSAAPFLKSLLPKIILYEDHGGEQTKSALCGYLRQLGYSIYGIEKHLTRIDLKLGFFETNDYVAVSGNRTIPTRAISTYRI